MVVVDEGVVIPDTLPKGQVTPAAPRIQSLWG